MATANSRSGVPLRASDSACSLQAPARSTPVFTVRRRKSPGTGEARIALRRTSEAPASAVRTERGQDLDDFAYIASHDLKEPLRGIRAYSEILLEDCHEKLGTEDQRRCAPSSICADDWRR